MAKRKPEPTTAEGGEKAKREHKATPEMAAAKRVARAKQALGMWVKREDNAKKALAQAQEKITEAKAEFEAARADLVSMPTVGG